MKKEQIIGVLVVALLVMGVMYLGRGHEIEELRRDVTHARDDIRLTESDALEDQQRLNACGKVVQRAGELIEAQARRTYRIYADEMPALAREAFDEGSRGDQEEFFYGTIRRLDEQRQLHGVLGQDLVSYRWAPTTSLAKGDTNLAAICLGIEEESLLQ